MSDSPVIASQVIDSLTPAEVEVHLANEANEPITMKVKIGYYRGRVTKNYYKLLEAFDAIDDEDEAKRHLDQIIMRMIGRWNVLQEAGGKPIPLTAEALFPVDQYFLLELLRGMAEHFVGFIPGEVLGAKQNGALNHTSVERPPQPRLVAGSRRKR